jgi:uncharacterized protein with PIN domain
MVIDASALVAMMSDEPEAEGFEALPESDEVVRADGGERVRRYTRRRTEGRCDG